MRLIAVALALGGLAACESCDWNFGPIPLSVHVTPETADATVVICDREGKENRCQTLYSQVDTGRPGRVAGSAATVVQWDGYGVCKYPELEVDVTAPGCQPLHLHVDHQRPPKEKGGMHLEAGLSCAP